MRCLPARHTYGRLSWRSTSRADHPVVYRKSSRSCASGIGTAPVGARVLLRDIKNQTWDEDEQGFKITAPTKP